MLIGEFADLCKDGEADHAMVPASVIFRLLRERRGGSGPW